MVIFRKNINKFVVVSEDIENSSERIIEDYDTFVSFLNEPLEIEHGTTFENFFSFIMDNWKDFEILYASHLGHNSLESFYKEWNSELPDDFVKDKLLTLRVSWSPFELNLADFSLTHANYISFDGKMFLPTDKMKKEFYTDEDYISTSLEFTPINHLKTYPIILCNEVHVFQWNPLSNDEKYKELGKYNQVITLYDAIGAIMYEISFAGTPQDREIMKSDLEQSMIQMTTDLQNETLYNESHEITLDDDGNLYIDGEKQIETQNLNDILKKFNIDKPREDNEE